MPKYSLENMLQLRVQIMNMVKYSSQKILTSSKKSEYDFFEFIDPIFVFIVQVCTNTVLDYWYVV